ncbi:MAG: hypothetical protein AAGG75_19110 [Bacteroidota bacterium]
MINSKLITLLSTFSTRELREFKDFVASPFFNKNEELVRFYGYLKKWAPEFPPRKIDRHKVFTQLYPDQPFDEKQMNYLMSFLLKLAEQYLGQARYQKEESLRLCHTLASCAERNLSKHYDYLYRKTQSKLETLPYRNSHFFYHKFLLSDIADQYFQKQGIRRYDEHLQKASDALDLFYLSTKLMYSCEMLDRENIMSAQYHQPIIPYIADYLQDPNFEASPPIRAYHQILLAFTTEAADYHFKQLKKQLLQHSDQLARTELNRIYLHGINFCIRKIQQGEAQYAEQALELYIDGIEKKVLFKDGVLTPWTYKNVVKLSLSLRKFEFTENFVRAYSNHLEEGFRENALHYNLAELYYYRKQYNEAMNHLNKVEFSDVSYNLGARKLLLKIYCDSNETEALHSQIAAFRIYLKRNKLIPSNVKAPYHNFVLLLGQLLRSKRDKRDKLREKIRTTRELTDRLWLLQKTEEATF